MFFSLYAADGRVRDRASTGAGTSVPDSFISSRQKAKRKNQNRRSRCVFACVFWYVLASLLFLFRIPIEPQEPNGGFMNSGRLLVIRQLWALTLVAALVLLSFTSSAAAAPPQQK